MIDLLLWICPEPDPVWVGEDSPVTDPAQVGRVARIVIQRATDNWGWLDCRDDIREAHRAAENGELD